MEAKIISRKTWNISEKLQQEFPEKTLKKFLYPFNQMNGGNNFFLDYYHEKLIVDIPSALLLCGYPKDRVQKENFGFLDLILKKKERLWLSLLWEKSADFFYNLSENECKYFIFLYEINIVKADGSKTLLHHKVVPFQLCENGNLWLAVGRVSPSISQKTENRACIVNPVTQTKYDFIKGAFVPSQISVPTLNEMSVLHLLVKDMLEADICKALNIKKGMYYHIRGKLFEKLDVKTPAGAVQRAHQLGII